MTNQITKLSDISYLLSWANNIAPSLGSNFQVDLDGGLYVLETATDDEMANAAGSSCLHQPKPSKYPVW